MILPFDKYVEIVDVQGKNRPASELSEDELIEKINNEISQWKLTQSTNEDLEAYFSENDLDNSEENEDDDHYYLEAVD